MEAGNPNRRIIAWPEWLAVLVGCAAASLTALAWSWRHGALLNYGDAVAHLHIARRVFDARLPRLTELGSVWLPLPHILMLPFVQVYGWWANGLAGAIPSALAYLAACAGIYRLARHWLTPTSAALALAFFALNPNLLYLQTTAMTEPLFVCEMVWIAVWLVEWRAALETAPLQLRSTQWLIAVVLIAAIFTRYDGWIMALVAWTCMGLTLLKRDQIDRRGRLRSWSFWLASVLIVAAPLTWFLYNSIGFGDWLYFARGPYSAKAIEIRTAVAGAGPPHPGWHNPWVALLFFVKAAEMDAAAAAWGNVLLVMSLLAMAWGWLMERRRGLTWALLLGLPIPFYAYSVAYGSVPIFMPVWWPHSWYNTRYGMEMLPAFALGVGFAARFLLATVNEFKPRVVDARWVRWAAEALFALILLNAWQMMREQPLVYVEGVKNIEARRGFEQQIPTTLKAQLAERPGAVILMDTSVYPNLVAFTGIPLRQTINESDLWIYQEALSAPAQHADLVLAFDGDEIDRAVKAHPEELREIGRFALAGQPEGRLYASDTFGSTGSPGPAQR
jgi:hypothetical protein